jgi:subtilisin
MEINDLSQNLYPQQTFNYNPIPPVNNFDTFNEYSFTGHSSFNATNVRSANFNSTSGYGLINAAAAVARAAGKNTFADVPALGGNNWGADLVKAPAAWAQGYTGRGVIVAVLDTGVDYTHPDLQNNIWQNPGEIPGNIIDDDGNGYIDDTQGWNFADNTNNVRDVNGHGTHVAGTIAGGNNGFGVTGIAYDAQIMPVKVLNDDGVGSSNSVANGIYYAVNNGARVINLSLGGNFPNSAIENAIQYASSQGAVVVMAAGNNGFPFTSFPASYASNWGLAVGAVDRNNNLANFSNRAGRNAFPYVTAPGVGIYSTVPGNQYASYSGTSMATPHVAGVVALMLSANPNLTDADIRQILIETASNSTPIAISGAFNLSHVIAEAIAQTVDNSTSTNVMSLDFNVTSVTEAEAITAEISPTVALSSANFTRHYDSSVNNFSSMNSPEIFNNDDINDRNPQVPEIEKIVEELRQQLDLLRRFLPII